MELPWMALLMVNILCLELITASNSFIAFAEHANTSARDLKRTLDQLEKM